MAELHNVKHKVAEKAHFNQAFLAAGLVYLIYLDPYPSVVSFKTFGIFLKKSVSCIIIIFKNQF